MTFRNTFLSLVAATTLLSSAFADIAFSSPSAGQTISGSTFTVEFASGSGQPPAEDFTSYTLQLCAGGNTDDTFDVVATFTSQGSFSSHSYDATISNLAAGANVKNAYFLRTLGVVPGGIVINYSDRFSLSSMNGQFSSKIQSGLGSISGTSGPPTENQVGSSQNTAAANAGAFGIAYTMQTGPTRYAPMPPIPGNRITKKGGPSPPFPTSAYNIWNQRDNLPGPNAQTTITQAQTFSYDMVEPTIAAQPGPQSDMQKFLNRWKD